MREDRRGFDMKKMSRWIALLITAILVCSLAACAKTKTGQTPETTAAAVETTSAETTAVETTAAASIEEPSNPGEEKEESDNDFIILYTNDTHGYIDNFKKKNDAGEPGLSFASVAAMKEELEDQGEYAILVDAGDHIQGTVYSAVDHGRTIISIMNAAGYDLATLGNHEFDYNSFRMFSVTARAWFPYVCCNLYEVADGLPLFPAYQEFRTKSGKKVAIIGIGTPESFSTPIRFVDDSGNVFLDYYGRQDEYDLYAAVQTTINLAKSYGADYVIALGHLGVDISSGEWRSEEVISHVRGLDAFIDGHSHTVMKKKMVKDASGKEIPLTQTGCYFHAFGKMTIKKDGKIDTELITSYAKADPLIRKMENDWINAISLQMSERMADTDIDLYITNPDNPDERIIRRQETNLGDLSADAIYSYYNDKGMDCDIAIVNSGGIRAGIPAGDISYLTCKSVFPFGNVNCLVELTGQQILDMLEWGTNVLGLKDPESGKPAESGYLMHCAGLRYTIDTTVPDTTQHNENDEWESGPAGEYRVRDVSVYNRTSGEYEPLDLQKPYRVGGNNYILRNYGGGMRMLQGRQLIEDYSEEDYLVFAEYLASFAPNEKGEVKVTSESSPLSKYPGYDLNYENPYGSGRIQVIMK